MLLPVRLWPERDESNSQLDSVAQMMLKLCVWLCVIKPPQDSYTVRLIENREKMEVVYFM